MRKLLILFFLTFAQGTLASWASEGLTRVKYTVGEKTFEAVIAGDNAASRATVFIVHDWNGLNDYEIKRIRMLAELGYRAVALDVFGVDAELKGFEDFRRESSALYQDRDEFRTRLSAGINATHNDSMKSFLAGYCFGGAAVLEGARSGLSMDGFVSFHGGLKTPEGQNYEETTAPILLLHGSADPVSGMADLATLLDELNEAGVSHDVEVYGGARHSFTVYGSRDYQERADKKSWAAMLTFLEEHS